MQRLRSNLHMRVSALAASVALIMSAGSAFGEDTPSPALETSAPTEMTVKPEAHASIKPLNFDDALKAYPRREDGKLDWMQSPDIKSGLISKKYVNFLLQREQFQLKIAQKGFPQFAAVDLFNPYDLGASNKELYRSITAYQRGSVVIGTMFEESIRQNQRVLTFENSIADEVAVEAMSTALNCNDLVIKRDAISTVLYRVYHQYEMKHRTVEGDPWEFILPKFDNQEQAINHIVGFAALSPHYLFPADYDAAKHFEKVSMVYRDLEKTKDNLDEYCQFLSRSNEQSAKLAKIILSVQRKNLPKTIISTAPAETSVPTERTIKTEVDVQVSAVNFDNVLKTYPRREDGKLDWMQSPDVKSGLISKKYISFLLQREQFQLKIAQRGYPQFAAVDLFNPYDFGASRKELDRSDTAYQRGATVIGTMFEESIKQNQRVLTFENSVADGIAIEAMSTALNCNDLIIKRDAISTVLYRVYHEYEMKHRTVEGDPWEFILPKFDNQEQAINHIIGFAALNPYYLFPSDYNAAKHLEKVNMFEKDLSVSKSIQEFCDYLNRANTETSKKLAKILYSAGQRKTFPKQ